MNITKRSVKEYLYVALGTFLVCLGVYYFLAPDHLAAGGVSGFSIVLNYVTGLPISIVSLIINAILLIVGFIFLGREFGSKTILSIILFSFYMFLFETFYPYKNPISDELLVNLFGGIIIAGSGLAIVLNQNASTGGTDIIAKILNKYCNLSLGVGFLVADAFVVTSSLITFGISKGIAGALGWFLNSIVINYFVDGLTVKREVVIISKHSEIIRKFIMSDVSRGITIYKAQGGYTNENKDIIVTILAKNEYFILKKKLKQIDPDVFMIVRSVHEVLGRGFE